MLENYHKYLEELLRCINSYDVKKEPFTHMEFNIGYKISKDDFDIDNIDYTEGRTHHRFTKEKDFYIDNLNYKDRQNLIANKLAEIFDINYTFDSGFDTNMWEDAYSQNGDATDIHIDYLQHSGDDKHEFSKTPHTVLTIQTYIPNDESHTELGTSFFKYNGDDISRDTLTAEELGWETPCLVYRHATDNFKEVKRFPFRNGYTVIHSNGGDSWHSMTEPVPKGYRRFSIGSRLQYYKRKNG